jgi:hypothetical protein
MWATIAILGFAVAVVALAWWIRRRQDPIDEYEERDYKDPPVFQGPDGPP